MLGGDASPRSRFRPSTNGYLSRKHVASFHAVKLYAPQHRQCFGCTLTRRKPPAWRFLFLQTISRHDSLLLFCQWTWIVLDFAMSGTCLASKIPLGVALVDRPTWQPFCVSGIHFLLGAIALQYLPGQGAIESNNTASARTQISCWLFWVAGPPHHFDYSLEHKYCGFNVEHIVLCLSWSLATSIHE